MEIQCKINLSSVMKSQLIDVAKKYSLDLLILFGSRAKGRSKKNSDYDLAYMRSNDLNLDEKEKLQNEIFKVINYNDFDLINISIKTPIILKLEIFRSGVVLFVSNKRYYESIKEKTYFDYVDSKSLLEPTKEKFLSSSL